MNYEEAISEIQGNERYNFFIVLAFSSMALVAAMDVNGIVYLSYTPPFKCIDEILKSKNITWDQNQCSGRFNESHNISEIYHCSKWKFDNNSMVQTITTEFQLICNKSSYVTWMNTLFFVGTAIGNFINIGGDKVGRIKMIQIFMVWEIVINVIFPFMTNIWIIILLRFLVGFGCGKLYQGICYLTEIISLEKRSLYSNNYWILYVFGYMLIPGLAYQTQDWRLMRHLMNISMVFYLFSIWIPESPRWLGIGGKTEEAKHNLLLIARRNGRKLPSGRFDSLSVKKEELGSFRSIFGTKTMRIKIIVLIFSHGTICLCYFGLSINETFISKDIFLNVFIQGLAEMFTGPVGWIASTKLNRKISVMLLFQITFVCLLVNNFINSDNNWLVAIKFTFALTGKFALTTCYCIMDMYVNEVFPTPIRNMSIFIVIGISSTFTVLAPSVNSLDSYISYFSSSCYSIMCFISGFLIIFLLPETKGCPLPQTMDQGEELRRGNEKNYCKKILDEEKLHSTEV